jgi:peptidoglycan/xylan/chitin deacetylase (PgdA/CDA1 family)
MRRTVLILLVSVLILLPLSAEVRFSGLHLSKDDLLLFSARTGSPMYGTYDTLLTGELEDGFLRQLTFFPEQVSLLEMGSKLQIRNRFGVFRSGPGLDTVEAVAAFPSFINGGDIETGKLLTISSSPDGRYLVYFDPVTYAYADLKLYDVEQQSSVLVSSNVELSYEEPPADWSSSSEYFIYHKGGDVYYYSIEQKLENRIIDESYRKIGTGDVSSVVWTGRNELYYIRRNLVYRILASEFFARSIYGGMLDIGTIVGKVPFVFNPNFDSFVVSPDGKKMLYNRSGRSLFLYFMHNDDYLASEGIKSLPYLLLPRNTRVKEIIWSSSDIITVLTGSIENGERKSGLYRIDLTVNSDALTFQKIPGEGTQGIKLSPDESLVAVMKRDGVDLKSYDTWSSKQTFAHAVPLHVLWPSEEELLIAGQELTELINLRKESRETLALSQAGSYGYSSDGKVVQQIGGKNYWLDPAEEFFWTVSDAQSDAQADNDSVNGGGGFSPLEASTAGTDYRVYLESITGGSYRNIVMVRQVSGYGTRSLFPKPEKQYDPFPERDEPALSFGFNHGSRIRRREVSLVFNAIDSPEGLTEALQILDDYDLRATFFVNGEFIRRNPGAVKELASSAHEIGSLFYVYFNMTDSRFKLDIDFIKRGLARNEDDFFAATNKELSLLWHAPFYFVSSDIISAGQEMNYRYIGRDVDPLDWVPEDDCSGEGYYLSSRDIVKRVMELKQPGSIIPVRLGELEEGRGDYLFQNLDLLVNALLQDGYSIVPVTTLIEHAR